MAGISTPISVSRIGASVNCRFSFLLSNQIINSQALAYF